VLRHLARDTAIYGASTLLVRGVQIVLIPVYTRLLAPAEYGVVDMVVVLGALVNLTVALEISQGVARYLADTAGDADRRAYASTAVLFSAGAYGLFALAGWSLAAPLGQLLFDSDRWAGALRIAVSALAVNGVFALLQDLLRWRLRPWAYAAASIAYTAVSAALGIYLVAIEGIGVSGVFWGQLAGALAGALVAAPLLRDTVGIAFDGARLGRMLAFSAPLVLSGVAVFANLFIDRIAVKELLGIAELGVYGVAARFASVLALLTVGLQAALTPLVFRNYRDPATAVALGRAFRYYCAAVVPAIGFLALFAGELLQVLVGPAFQAGRSVLPILALAAFFANLYIFAPGLFLEKRTGSVAGVNVFAAVLNLTLNLSLVPHLGIMGAALAAAAAAAAGFCGFLVLGQKFYPVRHHWVRSAVAIAVGGALAGAGVWWNSAPAVSGAPGVALRLLLLAAGTVGALSIALDREDRSRLCAWVRPRRTEP